MESSVHEYLGAGQLRRQIEFAPEIVGATGEDCFGTRLISAEVLGNRQNAVEVRASTAVLAFFLRLAQGLTYQVPSEDGVFLMRLVLWSMRLEVKAQHAGFFAIGLKLGQLTNFFARNHPLFSRMLLILDARFCQ